jgi:hypothetical protein
MRTMATSIQGWYGTGAVSAPSGEAPTTAVGDAGSLLPEPVSASGDPGEALAMLAIQVGNQERKNATEGREIDQRQEVAEDDQQVSAMRQKASDILTGGMIESAGLAVEASVQYVAAPQVMDNGQLTVAGRELHAMETASHAATTIFGAFAKSAEAGDEADAAAAKSAADQARGAADDMKDAKKSAEDLVSAAIDFYREYSSAQNNLRSAALHR